MALCSNNLLISLSLLVVLGAQARVFTLQNNCRNTIWPGIKAGPGHRLLMNGGLRLRPNQYVDIIVPDGWSGHLWGRRGCTFDDQGFGYCVTGDCASALECGGEGGTPPATLAEFTLGLPLDRYDVSLVDGYNMPISILPTFGIYGSCKSAGCIKELNHHCPPRLQKRGEGGRVVGCKSACMAFGTPELCCTGAYADRNTCKPSNYSRLFKAVCPTAYSYAYDHHSSTFTCGGADYLISFC